MLHQVIGKKITELPALPGQFVRVVADLGAGNGKFAYEYAKSHPDELVLAIDADADSLNAISFKAARKPAKGGLGNFLALRAAAEDLPAEFSGCVSHLFINFPWGSLLAGIVVPEIGVWAQISKILSPNALVEVLITYSSQFEPEAISQLRLPELTSGFLQHQLTPKLDALGFNSVGIRELDLAEKTALNTAWAKRIQSQRDRQVWKLTFCYNPQ